MGTVNQPEDLISRLNRLERELSEYKKSNGLRAAVITRGGLEVQDDVGRTLFRVGQFNAGGDALGFVAYRPDGSIQFWGYGLADGSGGFWGGFDRSGNVVLSEDGISGQGLARPWLPIPFSDGVVAMPQVTTTNAAFEMLQFAKYQRQHPKIYILSLIRSSSAGTTGEARILVGGVQIGSTLTINANDFGYWEIGPVACPGAFGGYVDIEVQARRTAGTGTIGVRVQGAYGEQS